MQLYSWPQMKKPLQRLVGILMLAMGTATARLADDLAPVAGNRNSSPMSTKEPKGAGIPTP